MRVFVVQGGPSTEAEVSRVSGEAVRRALLEAGHEVIAGELAPSLPAALAAFAPEVVFPVTHGELGEDGCLQGLLEVLGYRYVGSDVRASAIASDKVLSKVLFAARGLPLAKQLTVSRGEVVPGLFENVRRELGAAFVVKPPTGGSTIGISRLLESATEGDFQAALELGFGLDPVLLLETYHRGHEVTCGVLEVEAGLIALPPTLVRSDANDWYDFTSKYAPGGSRHECPAPFPEEVLARLKAAAIAAHESLGARDLSRTDFIVDEKGEFIVLELNNLPGMTSVSLFPEAAAVHGLSFPELVDHLVRRAAGRSGLREDRARALPGRL